MRVRFEMVVDLDDKAWGTPYDLAEFIRRLLAPYMKIVKDEVREEWYAGEFD